jgi:hypothetical protein
MASNRFAHRMHGVDSTAERRLRGALALNIAEQVGALREVDMRLTDAQSVREARQMVARMIADREQQVDALAMGVGHA